MTIALTPQQQAVCAHREGHALVQAVAGSGKTGTLVARVAALVEEEPSRVVRAVMFNRDAAAEFAERLEAQALQNARIKTQTFHSIGYALTQRLVQSGWLEPAVVETGRRWLEEAAQRAIRTAKSQHHGGRQVQVDRDEINGFLQFYDRLLGDVRDPDEVRSIDDPEYFVHAVEAVETERRQLGIRGYGHLLSDPVRCLLEHPEARQGITDRIDELLVDEFQDVNGVQYELVRLLAGNRARVVVCGDPDQTIYAWRGARVEFILKRFAQDFAPITHFPLTYSQRYGHEISALASHVIRHNRLRPDSLCVSAAGTPDSIVRRVVAEPGSTGNALDQAAASATSWSNVAIVCRLWSLAIPYQLECLRRGIPYQVESNRPYLAADATMLGLLAVLRIAGGLFEYLPLDERRAEARAFLSLPPLGISSDALDLIARHVAERPDQAEACILEATRHSTTRSVNEEITARAQLWSALQSSRWRKADPRALLEHHGRMTQLVNVQDSDVNTGSRRRQVWCTVLDMSSRIGETPAALCDQLAALLDRERELRRGPASEAMHITTVHSAKGLQWDSVVVPGLSEGVFPCSLQGDPDMEAERRLFYVALTRARSTAVLVTPPDKQLDEYIANRLQRIPKSPHASRFVYEAAPGWAIAPVARGETDQLVARDEECARRYLEAAGFQVSAGRSAYF